MSVLLLAEHSNGKLSPATGKALTAAKALGGTIDILVAGSACRPAAEAAAKLAGVSKVLIADAPHLGNGLAEEVAAVDLCRSRAAIRRSWLQRLRRAKTFCRALPHTSMSCRSPTSPKSYRPDTFERPVYAGNAIQTVQSADAKKVITVRTSTFADAPEGGSAAIEMIAAPPALNLFSLRRRRTYEKRPARTDVRENHHLRRPRHGQR